MTEYIKLCCIKHNQMTITTLAEKTGQSQPNLTNKLKRNDFKTSDLEKIAAALDANLEIRFIDKNTGQPII